MSQAPATPAPSKGQAGADPYSIPLDRIDVSDAELFETDTLGAFCASGAFQDLGSYLKRDHVSANVFPKTFR